MKMMNSMVNKRIEWIDNLRGMCMVFVYFHHSGSSPLWFVKFYVPIFLTSFFFVSGYLFHHPSRVFDIRQKLLNIFTSLVIPYFIYCFCCSCIAFFSSGIEGLSEQIFISLYGVKSWFISALILCQLFSLVNFVVKYRLLMLIMTIIASLILYFYLPNGEYFWNFKNSLLAYPFFACGILARSKDIVSFILNDKYVGKCSLLLYIVFVLLNMRYNLLGGSFNGSFSSYPMFFIGNIVGIPAIIYVCSRITRFNRLLLFIGANSLLYYYLPTLVNIVTNYSLSLLHITNTSFVVLILIVLFKCLLMIFPVWFINKYIPVFAGKYRIKIADACIKEK